MDLVAIAGLVVVVVVFLLVRDRRRDRRALETFGRRLGAHDAAITTLSRVVAALVPPDARPTRPQAPPAYATAPPPSAAARLERAVLPEPPVDMTGDRAGLVPEPPSAGERDSSEAFTLVMTADGATRAAATARRALRPPPMPREGAP